jgi:hypothetical protein
MRLARVLVCSVLILNSPSLVPAQQATPATPQAAALLQGSLSALNANQPLTDITLTASARRIAGSDDESGTATLKAIASGASSMNLSLSAGAHSEIMNASATSPTGSWSGPDAIVHPMAYHNLLTTPSWFFPTFALAASYSAPGAQVTYVGPETRNSQSVQHLTITQASPIATPPGIPTYAHLTQLDFYLDSTTLLPAALTFNTHPDNNMLLDIPVEIRFTSYTSVNGAQIPFHIQKFINNTLALDLQLQSAILNSGLSISSFTAQ